MAIVTKDAGIYDNERFRLPTDAENMMDYDSRTEFVGTLGGPGYGVRVGSDDATFLPVAGYRNNSGATQGVYTNGYYWSSRPHSATSGYYLYFYTSVDPSSYYDDTRYGHAVRCVLR